MTSITHTDLNGVAIELNLLAAQACEAAIRCFNAHLSEDTFKTALADHLKDLAQALNNPLNTSHHSTQRKN